MSKTDPRKLESYLEQKEAYDGGLEPDVERLVDSLQQWQHEAELQPRPGFLNEVAQQLYEQERQAPGPAQRLWSGLWQQLVDGGLAAAAAIAIVALFAAWLLALPGGPQAPAATAPASAMPDGAAEGGGEQVAPEAQAPDGVIERAWSQATTLVSRARGVAGWVWADVLAPPLAALSAYLVLGALLVWVLAFALRRQGGDGGRGVSAAAAGSDRSG